MNRRSILRILRQFRPYVLELKPFKDELIEFYPFNAWIAVALLTTDKTWCQDLEPAWRLDTYIGRFIAYVLIIRMIRRVYHCVINNEKGGIKAANFFNAVYLNRRILEIPSGALKEKHGESQKIIFTKPF